MNTARLLAGSGYKLKLHPTVQPLRRVNDVYSMLHFWSSVFTSPLHENVTLIGLTGVCLAFWQAAYSSQFAFVLFAHDGLNNKACVYASGSWNAIGLLSGAETQDVESLCCLYSALDAALRQLVDNISSDVLRWFAWWFLTI